MGCLSPLIRLILTWLKNFRPGRFSLIAKRTPAPTGFLFYPSVSDGIVSAPFLVKPSKRIPHLETLRVVSKGGSPTSHSTRRAPSAALIFEVYCARVNSALGCSLVPPRNDNVRRKMIQRFVVTRFAGYRPRQLSIWLKPKQSRLVAAERAT